MPNETFALEVEEVRERMRSAFATYYFTQLSVIQGVALAALFVKVAHLAREEIEWRIVQRRLSGMPV